MKKSRFPNSVLRSNYVVRANALTCVFRIFFLIEPEKIENPKAK